MTEGTWSNWSGSVRCRPRAIERPTDLDSLRRTVASVAARGGELRVAGSGHSFSPLVATSDTLISLEHLRGVVSVDIERQRATLWGGTPIHAMGEPLRAHGLGLINQGDIHAQAIAGAISTGTHGTGIGLGSLSTQVVGLTLVQPDGSLLELREEDTAEGGNGAEILRSARVAVGSLGVVAKVEMQLRPAYRLREVKTNMGLEECLQGIEEAKAAARHYELFWFPHTRRVGVKVLEETDEPVRYSGLGHFVSDVLLENAGWWLLCQVASAFPSTTPRIARFAAANLGEADRVHWSDHIFPNPRWVRFHEMEYAVPAEDGPAALRALAEYAEREKPKVHFPVEYRYVAADEIPLSPFYRRDSAVLSIHTYRRMPWNPYFSEVESLLRGFGGRPHWGKMHFLDGQTLAALYPEWQTFHALRRRLDPNGLFLNDYLRSLFGEQGKS